MYVVIDDYGCTLLESSNKEECKKFVKKEKSVKCEIIEMEDNLYYDIDYHEHEYNEYGECSICGDIKYGSYLYHCLYGGE